MCDKSIDERVAVIVTGITKQLGPMIQASIKDAFEKGVNVILLETTGRGYDERGKIKETLQCMEVIAGPTAESREKAIANFRFAGKARMYMGGVLTALIALATKEFWVTYFTTKGP
jgi:hypothetical protein